MDLGHFRRKPRIRAKSEPGAIPGTIKVDPNASAPRIRAISYGTKDVEEVEIHDLNRLPALLHKRAITWVNVDGLGNKETILQLGEMFGLHALSLEDVVNSHQRAKAEDYGDVLYIVVRMVWSVEPMRTEQLSIFLGKDFLLTFQEHPGDCFDPVRDRIRQENSRLRKSAPDYLAYRLVDAVIDSYFPVLERTCDRLELLDTQIEASQSSAHFSSIQDAKGELVLARRAMAPHREAINALLRDPFPQISEETRIYLRDCYDHTVQIMDLIETYRELCADLRDYYLALVSNRMNEVMKVLTIIATIFIPLGFIAGVYGMNFDSEKSPWNMPELGWTFGYPFALGLMGIVAVGMLIFFRRRGWLGSK